MINEESNFGTNKFPEPQYYGFKAGYNPRRINKRKRKTIKNIKKGGYVYSASSIKKLKQISKPNTLNSNSLFLPQNLIKKQKLVKKNVRIPYSKKIQKWKLKGGNMINDFVYNINTTSNIINGIKPDLHNNPNPFDGHFNGKYNNIYNY